MKGALRILFFAIFVRPLLIIILGLHVRHKSRLPKKGPAVIVANHNSHLDALALICLFPLRLLLSIKPVAAQDYFYRNPLLKWFALNIMGIIPLDRKMRSKKKNPLSDINESLSKNEIVILFPEGSRGSPECLGDFKAGIAHIAKQNPEVPVIPVFMHRLGKVLPKGEALLVPFFIDLFIGEPLFWSSDKISYMESLTSTMTSLAAEGSFPSWD